MASHWDRRRLLAEGVRRRSPARRTGRTIRRDVDPEWRARQRGDTLIDDPYERGHGTGKDPPLPVATFRVGDEPPLAGRTLPVAFADIERLPNGPVDDPITLDEGIQNGELVFTLNGTAYPNVPMLDIPQNAIRRFLVDNKSEMDHPFHIHGVFFQLLEKGGAPIAADALANKDTIIVPAKTTLKLVARFDAPGTWMYHCHILEHAEGGMMGEIRVQ